MPYSAALVSAPITTITTPISTSLPSLTSEGSWPIAILASIVASSSALAACSSSTSLAASAPRCASSGISLLRLPVTWRRGFSSLSLILERFLKRLTRLPRPIETNNAPRYCKRLPTLSRLAFCCGSRSPPEAGGRALAMAVRLLERRRDRVVQRDERPGLEQPGERRDPYSAHRNRSGDIEPVDRQPGLAKRWNDAPEYFDQVYT